MKTDDYRSHILIVQSTGDTHAESRVVQFADASTWRKQPW